VAVETLADAAVTVRPDFTKASSETSSGAKKMGESAGKAAGDSFTDKFSASVSKGGAKVKSVMSTLADTFIVGHFVGNMAKFGIQAAASLEQAKVGFTTLLGSATKAGDYLKQLQAFAAATPFELSGLIDSSRTLLGVGVNAKQVIPLLRAYGDAAGAVGVGQEAFQRIILATSQSISAGKFNLGDLNQVMTNGIPIYKILSEALGKPVATIRQMATDGKLLTTDVLPALQKQMEKDYGGAMAKQSMTLNGVWSTLKDTIAIGLSNALTPLIPIMSNLIPKAANVLSGIFKVMTTTVIAFADGFADGGTKLTGFAGEMGRVGAIIGAVVKAFTGGGGEMDAAIEPYAKLGEQLKNEVIPAHIQLAKELVTDVLPKVVQLATTIASTMIPIMYTLEELIKSKIVPVLDFLTGTMQRHETVVKDVALAFGGMIAVNKLLEVVTKGSAIAVTTWNTAVKLAEGVTKGWEIALKAALIPQKAGTAATSLSTSTLGTWLGVKALEIREYIAAAISAEGNTIAILANAAATRISTEANVLFAKGMLLVDAVMDANPFFLIAGLLVVLAAGFYLAWTHSATFRKIVEGAWNGIKAVTEVVVNWFMSKVVPSLVRAWNDVAAGALWLWHNVLDPVWHGIEAVIRVVVALVRGYIGIVIAEYKALATAAQWLYNTILQPIFHAVGRIIQAASAVIQLALAIVVAYFRDILGPSISDFYNKVVKPVFGFVKDVIVTNLTVAKQSLVAIYDYLKGPLTAVFNAVNKTTGVVWGAIKKTISDDVHAVKSVFSAIHDYISGPLSAVQAAFAKTSGISWGIFRDMISTVWGKVKPVLSALGNFVKNTIPSAFSSAVTAIGKAWNKVEAVAKTPITFTVTHVINPLINGFNHVAKAFGTPTIDPIAGFAEGGRIPGTASATDNKWAWLRDKSGNVLGPAGLATGEFVVNARDTAKALPLLQWINDGMAGGPIEASKRLGRPLAKYPGDGSEGWAFANGGLVGFLSDVWGAISNPAKLIKAPITAALDEIPGTGVVKDMVVGMGKKLISGLTNFLTGQSGGAVSGSVGAAQAFLRAQNGKPYVWASAGPGGYDCSGIVSAVYNILKGKPIYGHTFSTESAASFFPKPGPGGPLVAGWSHPGESPASATIGHMAGNLAGLAFESSGSLGVHLGPSALPVEQFANIGHFNRGGVIDMAQIARADFGSVTLERGHNLIYNGTGQREPLSTGGGANRMHPDDIAALAEAIGGVMGAAMTGSVPATRVAARQAGRRPHA
jgi:tape measure domain-containing protein